jgi:hypothetical protein
LQGRRENFESMIAAAIPLGRAGARIIRRRRADPLGFSAAEKISRSTRMSLRSSLNFEF